MSIAHGGGMQREIWMATKQYINQVYNNLKDIGVMSVLCIVLVYNFMWDRFD